MIVVASMLFLENCVRQQCFWWWWRYSNNFGGIIGGEDNIDRDSYLYIFFDQYENTNIKITAGFSIELMIRCGMVNILVLSLLSI